MTIHSIVIQKLLSTNAHIGRQVATHHFKEYTYGFRNRMAIIDSDKTLICMRSACNFIASLARNNGRFMFINTNPLFDEIFELMTKKVGSYSPSSNSLWRTGGFLSNSYSPKKFRSRNKKLCFGPTQPPDCIVIVDTESRSSVIDEAFKLQIPVVALVDSAMPLHTYSRIAYPIPANPSVQFVYLFCNLITKTLLLEKNNLQHSNSYTDHREEALRKEERKRKKKLAKIKVNVIPYANLAPLLHQDVEKTKKLLDKLVILKVVDALGTNMGFQDPKSAIDICGGQTFLDLIINQIQTLNSKYGCNVPFLLLNRDGTRDSISKVLEKYSESSVDVRTLNQGEGPESTLLGGNSRKEEVRLFDDGDILHSLVIAGTLDLLLSQGKEYILVMKSGNVATIIDPSILEHLMTNAIDYCMEVTPSNDSILTPTTFKLQEIARNQDKNLKGNFKLIDTTNMWLSLRAIRRHVDSDALQLGKPAISKENDYDHTLLQGKDAGPAIQFFDNAIGVSIPESHFHPLDATSDLLTLKSDLYTCREGVLIRNPARTSPLNPVIDLGPEFEMIGDFQSRFRSIPSIVELDSLMVRGDVWFGANITLKGQVTIAARPGLKLEIPDGVVIENKEINDPADIEG